MSKRYILGYCIIALVMFGGLLYWLQRENQEEIPPVLNDSSTQPQTLGTTNLISNQNKIMNATFHTNKGDITIEFFGDKTPTTVNNFVELAKTGFYDGVKFHRVIKDFMIQGGDPLSKDDAQAARWGTGGPGYSFKDEIRPDNRNSVGTISMANAGPNTNGSQFFINLKDNNFLDQKHTVFGRVTQGMNVVESIEQTPVNSADRPLEPIIIKSITLQ